MAKSPVRLLLSLVLVATAFIALPTRSVHAETPWQKVRQKQAHGGAVMQTAVPGAVVAYQVQARRFSLWYLAGPNNGRVVIYLNGAKHKVVFTGRELLITKARCSLVFDH